MLLVLEMLVLFKCFIFVNIRIVYKMLGILVLGSYKYKGMGVFIVNNI